MTSLSLRVDVDTLEGTLAGIPNLLRLLDRFGMQASFYFSMGPDNSGRAIRRIFRKGFLKKMRRTQATQLYGWKTLMYGVLLPAPIIYRRAAETMRSVQAAGHEVGLHAWDHVDYHDLLDRKSQIWLENWFQRAHEAFQEVFGFPCQGAVSPAWRCNDRTLEIQEGYQLTYAGDCRGKVAFYPILKGRPLQTLQIPTTLPTLDELLGVDGISAENVNEQLWPKIREDALNVYALHTEVEGGCLAGTFQAFLTGLRDRAIQIQTLKDLAVDLKRQSPQALAITRRELPGRAGWVSWGALD